MAQVLLTKAGSEGDPPSGMIIPTQGCSQWDYRSLFVEEEMGAQMDL